MKKFLQLLFRLLAVLILGVLIYLKWQRAPEEVYQEESYEPIQIVQIAPFANGDFLLATGMVTDPKFILGYGYYRLIGSDGQNISILTGKDAPLQAGIQIHVPLRIVPVSQWNGQPHYIFLQAGEYVVRSPAAPLRSPSPPPESTLPI